MALTNAQSSLSRNLDIPSWAKEWAQFLKEAGFGVSFYKDTGLGRVTAQIVVRRKGRSSVEIVGGSGMLLDASLLRIFKQLHKAALLREWADVNKTRLCLIITEDGYLSLLDDSVSEFGGAHRVNPTTGRIAINGVNAGGPWNVLGPWHGDPMTAKKKQQHKKWYQENRPQWGNIYLTEKPGVFRVRVGKQQFRAHAPDFKSKDRSSRETEIFEGLVQFSKTGENQPEWMIKPM